MTEGDAQAQQAQAQAQQQPAQVDYERLASLIEGATARKEEAVIRGYLEQQGLTGEEMARAVADFKAQRAAKAPDVEGMARQVEELRAQLAQARVGAAVAEVAGGMGLDPKVAGYVGRLADLSGAVGEDWSVDRGAVEAALSRVLDDLPQLRPQAAARPGFRVGGAGEGGRAPSGDLDERLDRAFGIKTGR